MIKADVQVVKKARLHHVATDDGTLKRFKPWLGDSISSLYAFIMERSICSSHYSLLSVRSNRNSYTDRPNWFFHFPVRCSPTSHLLQLFRIASALHLNLRSSSINFFQVVGREFD